MSKQIHIVTGALGYSGKYIARRLLDAGHHVRTLTNSHDKPNPFGDRIEVYPLDFNNPDKLVEYFRGKAMLERVLIESGVSYAILRPAVLFGKEDILINNIAWVLRRFPVFCVFGDGRYRLRPIYVGDL